MLKIWGGHNAIIIYKALKGLKKEKNSNVWYCYDGYAINSCLRWNE